ncbi:hypothetical protein GCM10009806_20060 [Microbacterium flavum]
MRDQIQRQDAVRQLGAGGDHQVAFDIAEVAHGFHFLRSRGDGAYGGERRPDSSRGFNTAAIPPGLAGNTSGVY